MSKRAQLIRELTTEQLDMVEKLSGINYSPRDIALYLGVNEEQFMAFYEDKESDLRYCYERGKLFYKAQIDIGLLQSAQSGNVTAAQLIKKTTKAHDHNEFKKRMLGGY